MRHFIVSALLLLVIAPSSWSQELSPEKFVEEWSSSLDLNDPKKQMGFYEASDETLVISSSGKMFNGSKSIAKEYELSLIHISEPTRPY